MESLSFENAPMLTHEPVVSEKPQAAESPVLPTVPAPTIDNIPVIPPAEILSETLLSYGFKATDENKALLKLMLENGIPLTKENVLKMNQAVKLTLSFEKALFMVQNNMRMTSSNAAQLEGFTSGQTKITNQISNLLAAVESLDDKALATQLKQILTGTTSGTTEKPQAAQIPQATTQAMPHTTAQATPQTTAQVTAQAAQVIQTPVETTQTAQVSQTAQNAQTAQVAQPTPQTAPQTPQAAPQVAQPTPQTAPQTAQVPQAAPQVQQPEQASQPAQVAETTPKVAQPTQVKQTAQVLQSTQKNAPVSQETPQPANHAPPVIPKNLLFTLKDSTPQSIEKYLNNLRQVLQQVTQAAQKSPEAARVLQEARTLESHIDFTSQIKNQFFAQLPIFHNDQQTLANLHVYKKKKTVSKNGDDSSSALIALETASMGHFETFVRKKSGAVNCQFRLESNEIVEKVRNNIHKLNDLLREKGYSLEGFSFLPPGEPYTILNNPTETPASPIGEDMPYFDKRV